MIEFELALSRLRPGVAWTLKGERLLENVEWPQAVVPVTKPEIDAQMELIRVEREVARKYSAASQAVRARLNALAQSWEYDDYKSAMAYVGSSVPKFDAEARAMRDAASAHWVVFDLIRAGEIEEPTTVDDLLALMPELPQRPAEPYN